MITLPPTGTKAPNAALNTLNRTFLLLALAGFVGSLVMLAKGKRAGSHATPLHAAGPLG